MVGRSIAGAGLVAGFAVGIADGCVADCVAGWEDGVDVDVVCCLMSVDLPLPTVVTLGAVSDAGADGDGRVPMVDVRIAVAFESASLGEVSAGPSLAGGSLVPAVAVPMVLVLLDLVEPARLAVVPRLVPIVASV